jgi:PAS domain S-box-containing protein
MTNDRQPDDSDARPRDGTDELHVLLREHDTRQRVFEAFPDAVVVVDAGGAVLDMNRSAAVLLGRTPDELIVLSEVILDEPPTEPWQGRIRIRRPDGSSGEALARSVVLLGGEEPLRVVVLSPRPADPLTEALEAAEAERERLAEAERAASEETRRVVGRIAQLQSITDAALVHLSLDQLFDELLGRLREALGADAVTVLLLDHDDRVLRIRATSGLERDEEQRLEVPFGVGVAGRIASEVRPFIVADLGRTRAVSPFLGGTLRSLAGVPIVLHGRVWGVLHVGSVRPRRFTDEDVALLELVASRLAPAIANADLLEAEHRARATAEEEARRLRLVEAVARGLATNRSVTETAESILRHVSPALGLSAAAVGLIEPDGRTIRVSASRGYDEDTIERFRSFSINADLPAAAAIREGRPVLLASEAERDRRFPTLAGTPTVGRSWAAVPLAIDDRPLGVLALGFGSPREFPASDVDLMTAIAAQCSDALDRAALRELAGRDREHSDRRIRWQALVRRLTERFDTATSPGEVAQAAVAEAAPAVGARSVVLHLVREDGQLELTAHHGLTPETASAWERLPVDLAVPMGGAIRSGRLEAHERPATGPAWPGRTDASTAAVPLLADGEALGTLTFTFAVAGPEEEDRDLLETIGRLVGQALTRSRLAEGGHRARAETERARERTERFQSLTTALADARSAEEALSVLTHHLVLAEGGVAAVAGRSREGRIEIEAARGYPAPELAAWSGAIAEGSTPLADAARARSGVWLTSGVDLAQRYPALADAQARLGFRGALAAVPLTAGDRLLGAVALQLAEPRKWTDADREFLRALARQAALAMTQADLREIKTAATSGLERSERRYRSLVTATSAIEWTVDPAGAFVEPQESWERYTGQSWELHRGFGWLDAIHEGDRELVMRRWLQARDTGGILEVEGRLWHAGSGAFRRIVSRAAPVRDDQGRIIEWVGTVVDVHERRAAEVAATQREIATRRQLEAAGDRLAYLAAASTILAESLDVDATLQRLSDLTVPRLADLCAVDMIAESGEIRLVAFAHTDPDALERIRDVRRFPPDPDADSGPAWVIRTGRSQLFETFPPELLEHARQHDRQLAQLVDGFAVRSMMVVPISLGDQVLGSMQFAWAESGLVYDRDDLALAEDLAHRAAIAIENARLFDAERRARQQEAAVRERLQILSEVDAAMAATLDSRRMLGALIRTASRRLADVASAYVVDPAGRLVDVVTAHRDPTLAPLVGGASAGRLGPPEDGTGLVARVLETGAAAYEPQMGGLGEREGGEDLGELGRRLRPSSGFAVPLSARGHVLGVLVLVRTEGSPSFSPEDLDLVTEIGRRAGSLLDNARLYAERRSIADTLQRSLLPPDLPEVPGLEIGARYLAAAPGTTVGGDFYDVFEIDLEHCGVVIGDVVGKGPDAAAMMALSRYTVRTAALTESRPSSLLATLNDAILRQMPEPMFCTACFVRIHRYHDSVRATICSGGHPLPLLLKVDGRVHEAGEPGTLLGVFPDPLLPDAALDLERGDALVFYTDGVTDERADGVEFGEERLRRLLTTLAGAPAQEIAHAVEAAVVEFATEAQRDDLAVLVVRVR